MCCGVGVQLDADGDGNVTIEEWLSYLTAMHGKKEAKNRKSADQWLNQILHTLHAHCKGDKAKAARHDDAREAAEADLPEEERPGNPEIPEEEPDLPTPESLTAHQLEDAGRVYGLVAQRDASLSGDPGLLYKEELVAAHGGEYRKFRKLPCSPDGVVAEGDWVEWLQRRHVRKSRSLLDRRLHVADK